MATVRNTVTLKDQMTPVLRTIVQSIQSTLTAMASIDNMSNKAFDGAKEDILRASNALDMFEKNMMDVTGKSGAIGRGLNTNVTNPMMRISAAIYTVQAALSSLGKFTGMSDQFMLTTSRLNMMNDGLRTTAELQEMIYQSAQRTRGSYQDQAAAVSKLGILANDSFKNTEEIVAFTELMNKSFVIGGAGAQEQTSAMYQLTQAMAAGKLQGDEFRSIMENAPMLAAAIAKFTGRSKGELKTMSSEGLITADIIKGAMFAAADDINGKFAQMPMTMAQSMQSIKNQALMMFQGVFAKMGELINSERFTMFTNGILTGLKMIANAAIVTFDLLIGAADFVGKNWKWLLPILGALTAMYVAYNAVAIITNTILGIQAFAAAASAAASLFQAGATFTATVAQVGLNAAVWAFPGTWIVAAVIAIIAALIAFALWLYDLWQSNIEFRVGVIRVWNSILSFFDNVPTFFQWVGNGMADAFGQAKTNIMMTMEDMVNGVIRMVNKMIDALNKIPGVAIGKMDEVSFGTQTRAAEAAAKAKRDAELAGNMATNAQKAAAREADLMIYAAAEQAKIDAKRAKAEEDKKTAEAKKNDSGFDWAKFQTDSKLTGGKIDSVGSINDPVSITDENLQYLKDVAATEFINKYTTLTPNIQVSFGDVRETADVSKLITEIENIMANVYDTSLAGA